MLGFTGKGSVVRQFYRRFLSRDNFIIIQAIFPTYLVFKNMSIEE